MNIIFFSPYFYPYISGLTVFPFNLLKHWAKKHRVTVLTFPHEPGLKPTESVADITIHRLPYWFKVSKGYISPQSRSQFSRYLETSDLVVTNLPNAEGVPMITQAHRLNKKILSIFHCQVNLGVGIGKQIINTVLNQAVQYQLNYTDRIICTSQDFINHCSQLSPYQNKTQAIYPPTRQLTVDKKAAQTLRQLKKDSIWIGFAGRIAHEKGIEYLIDAIDSLSTGKNIELVFAGPSGKQVSGESDYHKKITTLIEQKDIPHKFLGKLAEDRLGAFYQTIDMLVLPSINQTETFGLVQVEAMLLETPVIATNLPGVRVPIQKTGMGIIVEPKDSHSLAQAISAINDHRSKYVNQILIDQAHQIFNYHQSLENYDHILEDPLKSPNPYHSK